MQQKTAQQPPHGGREGVHPAEVDDLKWAFEAGGRHLGDGR
jgi:hypothetical protein